jgi:hypothetical protein
MKPVENESFLGYLPAAQFAEKTVVAMDLEDWCVAKGRDE